MSAEINYDTRLLKVKVEIFYTQGQDAGTKHYLNVGMLQDGLTSTQSGASLNPSAILPNGQYEHTHMFRGFLNTSGTWGDQIDAAETGVIVKEYEYTLPASINANTLDITKLGFYAILHKGKNTLETSQIITGAQVHPTYLNSPDAAMVNLKSVMGEYNVGCADWTSIQPKIKIKNSGRQVNKMKFEYTVNGQAKGDFTITEPLGAYELKTFALSNLEYFTIPNAEVGIKLVAVDDDVIAIGSSSTLTFNVSSAVEVSDPNITLEILTDNYPSETFGRFFKESFSNTVLNFGPFAAGTGQGGAGGADAIAAKSFNITLSGTGCYSLRLNDSYGDGMQYGPTPNPNGGFGYRIKQNGNVIVSNVQSNFDTGFFKDFIE